MLLKIKWKIVQKLYTEKRRSSEFIPIIYKYI